MKRWILLPMALIALGLIAPAPAQDGGEDDKPPLKERLKKKLVDRVVKELEKRAKYSRNDRLASGGGSHHTDISSGHHGNYDDVLVKGNDGKYRHLDGRIASADEIKKFEKRYSTYTERFVPDGLQKYVKIKDHTFADWSDSYTGDPRFKKRYESDLGHVDVKTLQLHAKWDARVGKFTFRDNFGLPHEGLGFKASSVVSLTVIDIRGESKTVKFDKGDFHLKSKLTFALNAGPYMNVSTSAIGTEYGGYSRSTFNAGLRANATVALPTDMEYRGFRFKVTPYVSGGASISHSGSMDYEMDWHGNERWTHDLNADRRFNWEAGVRVSVSFEEMGRLTRGIVNRLSGR